MGHSVDLDMAESSAVMAEGQGGKHNRWQHEEGAECGCFFWAAPEALGQDNKLLMSSTFLLLILHHGVGLCSVAVGILVNLSYSNSEVQDLCEAKKWYVNRNSLFHFAQSLEKQHEESKMLPFCCQWETIC